MKSRSLLIALMCLVATASWAQLQVPVTYDIGVGKRIEGVITGGAICEPEGLNVKPINGTGPVLLPYEEIDKLENMALDAKGEVTMQVTMRDGSKINGAATVTNTEPIVILQDETATGSATPGKVRTFSKTGFKGLPLIEFEAGLPPDIDIPAVKKLAADLVKALDDGDVNKAIDVHNQIGDLLEKADSDTLPPSPSAPKK
ncbi:MAG: hypothetical protein HQM09_09440 [Candidatus Riflebacteria bacterium]|nr:hypothetical protein [Candidatus Riflebacteria bacterium]